MSNATDVKAKAVPEIHDENEPETMEIETSNCLINRDSTVTIPVTCFTYEVDVLKEIHGELAVQVVSTKDVTVDAFNAADAYATLLRKYKQNVNDVRMVYNSPKALAKVSGLSYQQGDDAAVKFQQAEFVDNSVTGDAPAA